MWEKNCRGAEIVLQDGLTQVGSFFKIVMLDVSCLFFFLVAFSSVLAYVYLVSVSLSLLSVQYAPHHRSSTFLILSHTHHALHSMVFVYVARYEFVRVASHFSYPSINAPYKRCPGVIL